MPHQNMPLWHTDYFELKLLKKQPVQGHFHPLFSPWKQEINLPCERYLFYTRREPGSGILIIRDKNSRWRDFPGGAVIKNPLAKAGTWVGSLVREDPTCRGATKPVHHNYWARVPQLLKPTCLEPVLRNKRSHRKEKRWEAHAPQQRVASAGHN